MATLCGDGAGAAGQIRLGELACRYKTPDRHSSSGLWRRIRAVGPVNWLTAVNVGEGTPTACLYGRMNTSFRETGLSAAKCTAKMCRLVHAFSQESHYVLLVTWRNAGLITPLFCRKGRYNYNSSHK
jgi:hypothetical protein